MPFGMVHLCGPRMRQVDGVAIAPWQKEIFGVDVGHPIVSNGDFVVHLCKGA